MKTVYVDLCFKGWLRCVPVQVADDVNAKDFQKQLNSGDRHLSLEESLEDAETFEVKLSDFEVAESVIHYCPTCNKNTNHERSGYLRWDCVLCDKRSLDLRLAKQPTRGRQ